MKPVVLVLALAAFGGGTLLARYEPAAPAAPVPARITGDTACSLDGMLLAEYPGPKAQIRYADGAPDFFCDTTEALSIFLQPEQQRAVRGLFVQDMGRTDWDQPVDAWIEGRAAFYVHGSRRHGSMGPTLATFADAAAARRFADEFGGRVLRFEEVTPELVALDGGALHDRVM